MTGDIIGIVTWRSWPHAAGAVDLGRVVELRGDPLQPGQVDDDPGADAPDAP